MKRLLPMLAAVALAALPSGCYTTGVRVVASSATYTNLGDISWDEYKIPILSLYLGPKATVWVNKEFGHVTAVEVTGAVTNTTSALAVYESREEKRLDMRVTFDGDYAHEAN